MFHVYEDWTLEDPPRCFYVGIGSYARTISIKRNRSHSSVKDRYGFNRIVVLTTVERDFACEQEVRLIAEHHTYVSDPLYCVIGANLTPGGDHPGEMSHETRKKMSESHKGSKNYNWGGNVISDETRQKMKNAKLGKSFSEVHRRNLSLSHKNPSQKTRTKLSIAIKNRASIMRLEWNISREKSIVQYDMNGNVVATFSSINEAAEKTSTSRSMISQVINGHRTLAKGYSWRLK